MLKKEERELLSFARNLGNNYLGVALLPNNDIRIIKNTDEIRGMKIKKFFYSGDFTNPRYSQIVELCIIPKVKCYRIIFDTDIQDLIISKNITLDNVYDFVGGSQFHIEIEYLTQEEIDNLLEWNP